MALDSGGVCVCVCVCGVCVVCVHKRSVLFPKALHYAGDEQEQSLRLAVPHASD